ncbi:MAG: DUF3298 domain-containing protein [Burkholderiaceae bacterium]|nr:DUF3298 domain-containing protein [Burkholderiaceae bacterium]
MVNQLKRTFKIAAFAGLAPLLVACASAPSGDISLIPAQIAQETSKDGLFTQAIKWEHSKPGCKGECPTITLDSLVFPGIPRLTELVDHALSVMTGIDDGSVQPYSTVAGYQDYFWQTAAPRDSTVLSAKTRYRNRHLTVVELNSFQYFTGAAHGISATQFLNWNNDDQKVLGLAQILQTGQHDAYIQALRQAHALWLSSNPDATRDPAAYARMWPFQPSENFGFTDQGLVVKYDSYQIAPYSSGQPELLIPYGQLQGIVRPEYLPAS